MGNIEDTRAGIEFLMLYIEPDRKAASDHISRRLTDLDDPLHYGAVITGLLDVGMFALFHIAKLEGAPPDQYADHARRWLARLSQQLPEIE